MQEDVPFVTVVIATHNEQLQIRSCLDSFAALEWPRDRLEIIVADSSTDRTPAIVEEYPSIKLMRFGTLNVATKRNEGIKVAHGKLIAITDGDCTAPPNWLKTMTEALSRKRFAAACGDAFPPPGSSYFGRCVAALGVPAGGSLGLGAAISIKSNDRINRIVTCNAIFRRQVFDEIGIFDESMPFASDTELSLRIASAGKEMRYARGSYVYHAPRRAFWPFVRWNVRRGAELKRLKSKWPAKISTWQYWLHGALLLAAPLGVAMAAATGNTKGALIALCGILLIVTVVFGISDARYSRALLTRWQKTGLNPISVILVLPVLSFIQYCARAFGFARETLTCKTPH